MSFLEFDGSGNEAFMMSLFAKGIYKFENIRVRVVWQVLLEKVVNNI